MVFSVQFSLEPALLQGKHAHTQIASLKEIFMLLWEQWQDQPHRARQKGKFLKAAVSLQNSNYNFKQRIY